MLNRQAITLLFCLNFFLGSCLKTNRPQNTKDDLAKSEKSLIAFPGDFDMVTYKVCRESPAPRLCCEDVTNQSTLSLAALPHGRYTVEFTQCDFHFNQCAPRQIQDATVATHDPAALEQWRREDAAKGYGYQLHELVAKSQEELKKCSWDPPDADALKFRENLGIFLELSRDMIALSFADSLI